jgi:hypothetical protein
VLKLLFSSLLNLLYLCRIFKGLGLCFGAKFLLSCIFLQDLSAMYAACQLGTMSPLPPQHAPPTFQR